MINKRVYKPGDVYRDKLNKKEDNPEGLAISKIKQNYTTGSVSARLCIVMQHVDGDLIRVF
jgi:hypothetical protein